ncbi:hypothetical protein [Argonema galeatum]|uniref:hypothetical protein n=1 Tax=Argonema galeatum TaxID=2942762 RepID=UPI00201132D0|nr:hypothetical protein [Argonema galeatum]MCL1467242.1 hypothetical protein [Argonema galeatum A003/A1]
MNYLEQLETYKKVISISERLYLSLPNITQLDYRYKWASSLFIHLITQAKSILTLLPASESNLLNDNSHNGDLSSIASLIMNLTETYQMFYYLSVDNITEEEAELRALLMLLHQNAEEEEFAKKMDANPIDIETYKQEKNRLREKVKTNNYYSKISELPPDNIYNFIGKNNDEFYRFLKNKKGHCLNAKEINKKMLFKVAGDLPSNEVFTDLEASSQINVELGAKRFDGLDTYFSNHTHASLWSISEMSYEIQVRDDTKHFFSLSIRHGIFYIGIAIFDILEIFSDSNIDINNQDTIALRAGLVTD